MLEKETTRLRSYCMCTQVQGAASSTQPSHPSCGVAPHVCTSSRNVIIHRQTPPPPTPTKPRQTKNIAFVRSNHCNFFSRWVCSGQLPGHFCKHCGLPSSGQAIHQGKLVPQNKSGCSKLLQGKLVLSSARRATEDVGHSWQPQPAKQWASVGLLKVCTSAARCSWQGVLTQVPYMFGFIFMLCHQTSKDTGPVTHIKRRQINTSKKGITSDMGVVKVA